MEAKASDVEAERKFRARQEEFVDLLNRYEPSCPFRYRKFHSYPRYSSGSSDFGSGQQAGRSPWSLVSWRLAALDLRVEIKLKLDKLEEIGLKLEKLKASLYKQGNKSLKTTEYSDNFTSTNIVLRKTKPCNQENFKNYPKNTLKDPKACGKTKGLVHRSSASKSKKKCKPKSQFVNFNILSNNIRGLASKKASLEDILETNDVDICCVQ